MNNDRSMILSKKYTEYMHLSKIRANINLLLLLLCNQSLFGFAQSIIAVYLLEYKINTVTFYSKLFNDNKNALGKRIQKDRK